MQQAARIAIDLGAESCRVSLLRWSDEAPRIEVVLRFANGPVHRGDRMHWPLETILTGLESGLRKAAAAAPEGIASIAVDGWSVDYVRLDAHGKPLAEPFCYRDERTAASQNAADRVLSPEEAYKKSGAQPLRLNTVYQLMADPACGIDAAAPWVMLPEYILMWLGGRRVAEYTNATHTGLVDIRTRNWSDELFSRLGIPLGAAPPIVSAGTALGIVKGPLAALPAYRNTQLIAPACHDTASAIAAIPASLDRTLYISSGTWSLVGTLIPAAITTPQALAARYTNQGAATGGYCFHTNVNGMWPIKQCMDAWAAQGRSWRIEDLVEKASACPAPEGVIDVDAEPLLVDGEMPARINAELTKSGLNPIPDVAGNEPAMARLIFESLAARYKNALLSLESMLGYRLGRISIIGGGSRNQLLSRLTAERTGLPVHAGHPESSTVGNFAVQLAAEKDSGRSIDPEELREWARKLQNA